MSNNSLWHLRISTRVLKDVKIILKYKNI
jgi:hypothetical protein